MPKPISPSTRAEALELRSSGWKLIDIGAALGVSPQAVGRWSKDALIVPARPKRRRQLMLDASHPDYGNECPECGGEKSEKALMCSPCRSANRVGQSPRTITYSADELVSAWPMPVGFPPVVAIPRTAHASE